MEIRTPIKWKNIARFSDERQEQVRTWEFVIILKGGGFVVLEKDRTPSPISKRTEHTRKQNIREVIMKAMEKNNQKPKADKFEVEVKTPAQKYMKTSEDTEVDIKESQTKEDVLQEIYLKAQSQPNMRKDMLPEIQTGYLKNSDQMHDRSNEATLEERVYEAARRAILDAKKERQIELTQQLMDLQSQGFIKNIPTKEGPIRSVEESLAPRSEGQYFQSTNKKDPSYRTGFSSNAKTVVSHQIEPFHIESQESQESERIFRFGETNAFSETLDQAPSKLPYQEHDHDAPFFGQKEPAKVEKIARNGSNSLLRNQEPAVSKPQKDFIIRNVKNLPSNPSSKKSTQTGFYNPIKNNQHLEVPLTNEEIEDTIGYEDTEDWSTPTKVTNQQQMQTKEIHKSVSSGITNVWEKALKRLEEGDLQSAYQEILDSGIIIIDLC